MPQKFVTRLLAKFLFEPQLLDFVDFPEEGILQDLDPLDFTYKRLRSERDVVGLEDDLLDELFNRVDPVIRKCVSLKVRDNFFYFLLSFLTLSAFYRE
jgi:hypothetical protein